jgi:2-oxoglutarate ferredoxin oxidoreductase subunit delta
MNIEFDEELCKGCYLCIHFCPKRVIAKSQLRNAQGRVMPCVVNLHECSKCRTCELMCPEFAVTVVEGEQAKKGG